MIKIEVDEKTLFDQHSLTKIIIEKKFEVLQRVEKEIGLEKAAETLGIAKTVLEGWYRRFDISLPMRPNSPAEISKRIYEDYKKGDLTNKELAKKYEKTANTIHKHIVNNLIEDGLFNKIFLDLSGQEFDPDDMDDASSKWLKAYHTTQSKINEIARKNNLPTPSNLSKLHEKYRKDLEERMKEELDEKMNRRKKLEAEVNKYR